MLCIWQIDTVWFKPLPLLPLRFQLQVPQLLVAHCSGHGLSQHQINLYIGVRVFIGIYTYICFFFGGVVKVSIRFMRREEWERKWKLLQYIGA